MDEIPRDPEPGPDERVERIEVVERVDPPARVEVRRGTPMWVWLLPLVFVVIVLAWFIFTRGEPQSPVQRGTQVEITAPPAPEPATPAPTIELPAVPETDAGPNEPVTGAPAEADAPVPADPSPE